MGMYDTMRIAPEVLAEFPMPPRLAAGATATFPFQTKSFNCDLDCLSIDADGRVFRESASWDSEAKAYVFGERKHLADYFGRVDVYLSAWGYTCYPHGHRPKEMGWYGLNIDVIDGKVHRVACYESKDASEELESIFP